VSDHDWQDPDPTAYDPDNPLALLEKAAIAPVSERAMRAAWAVNSMLAAGPNATALTVAKDYVKRHKLIAAADFDSLVRESRAENGTGPGSDVKSASTVLVDLARERYTFGISDTGDPFAVPVDGPKVVAMLRGGKTSLRAMMAREYFTLTGRAATQQALADALMVVEGIAQDTDESRLYLRTAQHQGALWLDLGDHTGRVVRITANGWTVEDSSPVLFRRTALTGVLPEPKRGDDLGGLWDWLNVTPDDRSLVAAELVARLFSEQPHVILSLLGEQGTGKSTALRVLVSLLDPSPVPLRKPPRDADSWITAAAGSWVVGLDNLSDVPPWLSDSLCRASTGDGDVRRKLYSDSDYTVFSFRRCVLFSAIDVGALAPDLADRTVAINLDLISDEARSDEETFWGRWADAHPQLLGAVLDLAARVIARLPAVKLTKTPRMADFARILAAVDAELGSAAFSRYSQQAENLAEESLDNDPFARAIRETITDFTGTSGALLQEVKPQREDWKPPKGWPASSRAVTGKMKRLAPAFRKTGWQVAELPAGHENALRWQLSSPARTEKHGEDTRVPSQDSPSASNASQREQPDGPSPYVPEEKNECLACHTPMKAAMPGQAYHPLCEPEEN
jgi:hypothetical protein